jgi:cytochrome oxidase Cu insertion factor (SCO1/SenC/PrrC family)
VNRQINVGLTTVVAAWLALAGCSTRVESPTHIDDFGPVGDFSLTDQNGSRVSRADLMGKVWVASFVFTRCNTVCPMVSGAMASLQDSLGGQPNVMLITLSVDPDHDQPAVLREYAKRFHADSRRWLFLTGDRAPIYRLIRDSFHLGVEQTPPSARTEGNEVTHSTKLAVIDRQGHIRGYFDGASSDGGDPSQELGRVRQLVIKLTGDSS